MNMGFSFLLASVIITGVCILICIVYMSYKISEAWHSMRLIDAEFPSTTKHLTKKNVKKLEDFYNRPASEARFAMGLFYSDENVNALRRKTSPIKLPKGRYNIRKDKKLLSLTKPLKLCRLSKMIKI